MKRVGLAQRSDHRGRADHKEASDVAAPLLRDPRLSFSSAAAVGPRRQPEPGRELPARPEDADIRHGHADRAGGDGADARDARDARKSATPFTSAMARVDFGVQALDLRLDRAALVERPRSGWVRVSGRASDVDSSSTAHAAQPFRRHDAEFHQMRPKGVDQHGALAHEEITDAVMQEHALLLRSS